MKREIKKYFFCFCIFLVSFCSNFRSIYFKRYEVLCPSWWPFVLYTSYPVGTSWEIIKIRIACELAQDFRTCDGFSWKCCFPENKIKQNKTSLVCFKQNYFFKILYDKVKTFSGLMKQFSKEGVSRNLLKEVEEFKGRWRLERFCLMVLHNFCHVPL